MDKTECSEIRIIDGKKEAKDRKKGNAINKRLGLKDSFSFKEANETLRSTFRLQANKHLFFVVVVCFRCKTHTSSVIRVQLSYNFILCKAERR